MIPDRILSFDPEFFYRFTNYFAIFGQIPLWDELTYFAGRSASGELNPLMIYLTAFIYWVQPFGWSLLNTAAVASAFYGAALIFPAYLLGKELSNRYGGLLAAILIGTAPQILIRTFGGSYDTDQMAVFFILFSLYAGIYALKRKTIAGYCLASFAFILFSLAWGNFTYTIYILIAAIVIDFLVSSFEMRKEPGHLLDKLKKPMENTKSNAKMLAAILITLFAWGFLIQSDILGAFISVFNFATRAEAWIVNISIAELQPFNIFNLQGWQLAMGRFMIGDAWVDNIIFLVLLSFLASGLYFSYKKDKKAFGLLLSLLVMGIATTFRGIRFTEFSSITFIVLVSVGFGYLVEYTRHDKFLKTLTYGTGLFLALFAFGLGYQLGLQLGPDSDPAWDQAMTFLKDKTPELSVVGTWWDPGHKIAALAERRNMADGAHCDTHCFYTINDRIVDAGRIMSTANENESVNIIKKYVGSAPKFYWIASDDLIGKFQWVYYFGTGCDGRSDPKCQLYMTVPQQKVAYNQDGSVGAVYYGGNILVINSKPMTALYIQNRNAYLVKEVIYFQDNEAQEIDYGDSSEDIIAALKPLESQMGFRLVNGTAPFTVSVSKGQGYVTIIPPNLRNSVFTKMFMMEGKGLENFKLVFNNERIKIFEVLL